jgi:CRISPR/Cas system-associated protein Cas5 (RAMP superfamily)
MTYAKILTALGLLAGLGGCVSSQEKEEFICLKYKTILIMEEKCRPFYGTLVCMEQESVRLICTRKEKLNE